MRKKELILIGTCMGGITPKDGEAKVERRWLFRFKGAFHGRMIKEVVVFPSEKGMFLKKRTYLLHLRSEGVVDDVLYASFIRGKVIDI